MIERTTLNATHTKKHDTEARCSFVVAAAAAAVCCYR